MLTKLKLLEKDLETIDMLIATLDQRGLYFSAGQQYNLKQDLGQARQRCLDAISIEKNEILNS